MAFLDVINQDQDVTNRDQCLLGDKDVTSWKKDALHLFDEKRIHQIKIKEKALHPFDEKKDSSLSQEDAPKIKEDSFFTVESESTTDDVAKEQKNDEIAKKAFSEASGDEFRKLIRAVGWMPANIFLAPKAKEDDPGSAKVDPTFASASPCEEWARLYYMAYKEIKKCLDASTTNEKRLHARNAASTLRWIVTYPDFWKFIPENWLYNIRTGKVKAKYLFNDDGQIGQENVADYKNGLYEYKDYETYEKKEYKALLGKEKDDEVPQTLYTDMSSELLKGTAAAHKKEYEDLRSDCVDLITNQILPLTQGGKTITTIKLKLGKIKISSNSIKGLNKIKTELKKYEFETKIKEKKYSLHKCIAILEDLKQLKNNLYRLIYELSRDEDKDGDADINLGGLFG